MNQVRTKEEFVVSLDLVPLVGKSENQALSFAKDNQAQLRNTSDAATQIVTSSPIPSNKDVLSKDHIVTQSKGPSSLILVPSNSAQSGIMSIVGQTILKIDSGKRMFLVPSVSQNICATSNLASTSNGGVQVTDSGKKIIQAISTSGQSIKILPPATTEPVSKTYLSTGVASVSTALSVGKEALADFHEPAQAILSMGSSNRKVAHQNDEQVNFTEVSRNSSVVYEEDKSLKELLKKDTGMPMDNLDMLAHVSNQIFGAKVPDQSIVYKRLSSATEAVHIKCETNRLDNSLPSEKGGEESQLGAAVSRKSPQFIKSENNRIASSEFLPALKQASMACDDSHAEEVIKSQCLLEFESKVPTAQFNDGIRRRKVKLLCESGSWRGRRVGHPFNPNSLPPPFESPAYATCVLYEHTMLKMATRGFWGGNKGSMEDVFRSIRIEATDFTDTVEDVTKRCYEFVRKKLMDLKEKRSEAFMFMRSYIDEFDNFLERVPPVAVIAMVIYLPMAADYELVTWHGVPPTGWSEYRRAVIMREVFEVLYHLGRQSDTLPEYDRSFFQPRSHSKILKERIFDTRKDRTGPGVNVRKGPYVVIYSGRESEISEASMVTTIVPQVKREVPSSAPNGALVSAHKNVNNSAESAIIPECGNENETKEALINQLDQHGVTLESHETKILATKRKSDLDICRRTSLKRKRPSSRRRTRSSTKDSAVEETSDLSSQGADEDGDVEQDAMEADEEHCQGPSEALEEDQCNVNLETPSVITPQFVQNIVSACGNASSWISAESTEASDASLGTEDVESNGSPENEDDRPLVGVQQSVVFESLWTKRAPVEPVVVSADGTERRLGEYLGSHGVETFCPSDKTILIVDGIRYRAKEVLGYFRRGVQFVEHTKENGTIIDTMTTMKEDVKVGAVRKIPPGKISKLVHPSLHLENYTAFVLPIGVTDSTGVSFKRKGFRHRLKRARHRSVSENITCAEVSMDGDEDRSPKSPRVGDIAGGSVRSPKQLDRRKNGDGCSTDKTAPDHYGRYLPQRAPATQDAAHLCGRDSILSTNSSSSIASPAYPRTSSCEVDPAGIVLMNGHNKECQTEASFISSGIQTETVPGILEDGLNVRLATLITDGIFRGFKRLIEEDNVDSNGNLSHLYTMQSLIDSYKKAGRFLLEMAENLETIMSSDSMQRK